MGIGAYHIEQVGWEGFLRRPVGTGPYMVEGEVEDYRKVPEGEVYAILVANPDYYEKGHPKIRRITFCGTPQRKPSVPWSRDGSI